MQQKVCAYAGKGAPLPICRAKEIISASSPGMGLSLNPALDRGAAYNLSTQMYSRILIESVGQGYEIIFRGCVSGYSLFGCSSVSACALSPSLSLPLSPSLSLSLFLCLRTMCNIDAYHFPKSGGASVEVTPRLSI